MSTTPWSLRTILALATLGVVSLALLVSGVLVVLTSALHSTTASAALAVESVRTAQQTEIDLLLHSRGGDPLVRRSLEEKLASALLEVERFVNSAEEARVVAEATAQVKAYIAAARDRGTSPDALLELQESAFGALDALVSANLADARAASAKAAAWDGRADLLGFAVGALLLVAAAGFLLWLRRGAFAPLLALAHAMERFGQGARDARVEEEGPAELREMIRRFNEMADALAVRRQSQIAFLGGVAHDLRNPLAVLKLSLAIVPPDQPLPAEPRLRHMIEKIARQIARLDRMAGDFLDIAKIEAGELDFKLAVHDACELVRHVTALFADTPAERRLRTALPSMAAPLMCDPLRMEQVLTNLISNAMKYSPDDSPVDLSVEVDGKAVVFTVVDRGVGIQQGEQQRVFEPFRRVGLSKEAVPGAGLGLFVVRRIVEAHGGRIELESAPGVGSTFRVRVPAERERSADVALHEGQSLTPASSRLTHGGRGG